MSLSPSLTSDLWLLLKSTLLQEAQAKRMSEMFGSRKELTANLMLDPAVFGAAPQIRNALIEVARCNYAAAQTPRPRKGDAKARREMRSARDEALTALIMSESDRMAVADTAHVALRAFARQEDHATLGYQWWVAQEAR